MKVLFLTDGIYPFQLGGMQKHSLILSKLLCFKGVKLKLVHCGGLNYSSDKFEDLYSESPNQIEELMIEFPKGDKLPGHYIRENKSYSKHIYNTLRGEIASFDLIYAQGFTGWEFIRRRIEDKSVPPVLLNFHGYEMFQKAPNLRVKAEYLLFKKVVKWNVLNADYVYSFGGIIDEILVGLGVSASKILSQSNGIEKEWLIDQPIKRDSLEKTRVKYVFIGRNERRKGIEELNAALSNIIGDPDLDFEFNFIGPIPENSRIDDDRVIYHGEVRDHNLIKEILRNSDCLVCPSHSEGMPTVILEAMASGLAIIGTRVGAVERQVRGNGVLIDQLTVSKLEDALLHILQLNEQKLLKYKSRSLELVEEKFLWDVIAEQKISDFNRIIKSSKN